METQPATTAGRRKLLLAEDDPDMRWLLAYALRKEGYDVLEVSDGVQLRALLWTFATGPGGGAALGAVISDLRMPGASGLDVLAELRAQKESFQSVPFILITGFGDEVTHEAARRLGAEVFDKPLDLDAFGAAVRALSQRR